MRGLPKIAFLALLAAACTVTTTGAPCATDLDCPSDQGCGSDGACSTDALSCPGHTLAGQCRPGTSCSSGQLVTCTATSGVCSTGPVAVDCPANQACAANGAEAACRCAPSACSAATSSFCDAGGQVVTCAQDGSNALGCWYEASAAPCTDPGASCTSSGAGASCACPTAGACTVLDATTCDPGGGQVLRCSPVVAGSSCLTWQPATDCAAGGLTCTAGACACPQNPGPTFVADAVSGSAAGASPAPTGVSSPAACRFRTLTDALLAASARGPGSIAKAAGWTPAGGAVSFSEPGALAVGAGVTLTTDDDAPTPAHYVVSTAASLSGPFVTLHPGSSLSGLELRNAASTGAAVETACPSPGDAAVAVSGVRIVAAAGDPAVRFAAGVRLAGHCPATLASVAVEGAATGIAVEAGAPSVETAATTCRVTGSTGTGISVVEGRLAFDGGTVDANATGVAVGAGGTGAPAFSATGTTFSGNAGDAAYVARGSFTSDACPYTRNGTHVHAQPAGTSSVSVTVRNSSGAAAMSGATNSAFRLLALGSGSTVVLSGNAVTGNDAAQSYNVASGLRRGGGMVITAPFAGSVAIRGNSFFGNKWDQVLVAASAPDSINLSGGTSCGQSSNVLACFDAGNAGVGLYSNGATVDAAWNSWTRQPAVYSIDVGGSGVLGYDTSACTPAVLACP